MINTPVTGTAGFVGSHLAAKLAQEGHTIIATSRSMHDALYTYLRCSTHTRVAVGDLTDRNLVRHVLVHHDISVVYPLAASAIVKEALKDPWYVYHNNTMSTLSLPEAAREPETNGKSIHLSTDKVYGDKCQHTEEEDPPYPRAL